MMHVNQLACVIDGTFQLSMLCYKASMVFVDWPVLRYIWKNTCLHLSYCQLACMIFHLEYDLSNCNLSDHSLSTSCFQYKIFHAWSYLSHILLIPTRFVQWEKNILHCIFCWGICTGFNLWYFTFRMCCFDNCINQIIEKWQITEDPKNSFFTKNDEIGRFGRKIRNSQLLTNNGQNFQNKGWKCFSVLHKCPVLYISQ